MSEKAQPSLEVLWEEQLVGHLSLNAQKGFVFAYDRRWLEAPDARPISLGLPVRTQPFEADESRPFFANLLPEARIRRAISQQLGISEGNDFGLLEALGGECAGAIALWPTGGPVKKRKATYEPVTRAELDRMVSQMSERPLLMGSDQHEGLRLSLAGAQAKIPVRITDRDSDGEREGAISLPRGSSSSTHILKPPIAGFKGSVENEAFCMRIAASLGLGVPESFILPGKTAIYATTRYDRRRAQSDDSENSPIARVHQEDFCQALLVLPDSKYEAEGGPSFATCFKLVGEQSAEPLSDRLRMLRWAAFNHLIGNADAHAKNLSLLYLPVSHEVVLAPFYDLMCTRIYPKLTENAAMRIGGERKIDAIQRKHWENLAAELSIKPRLVLETVRQLADALPEAAKNTHAQFKKNGWDHPILGQLVQLFAKRSRKAL